MDNIQYKQKEGNFIQAPVFDGKTIDKMPELVAQGYTPISVAGIMEQRINAWQSGDQELAKKWSSNFFDSADGIIYHPDGRIKVVPESQTLREINSNTPLKWYGSLPLQEGTFDSITEGVEFSKTEVEKFANKYLKQNEARENPIWLALAQDDKELLKEYVGQVYSKLNDPELMKVRVSEKSPKFECERLWCLGSLGNDSNVFGNNYGGLVGINGRLVGVAPKVQDFAEVTPVATKINLEALVGDFKTLSEEGFLTQKTQELYLSLQKGKYNL